MSGAEIAGLAAVLTAFTALMAFVTAPTAGRLTALQDELARDHGLSLHEAAVRARAKLRRRRWLLVGIPLAGALVLSVAAVALGDGPVDREEAGRRHAASAPEPPPVEPRSPGRVVAVTTSAASR